jgi:hypothetical protein
VLRPLLSFSHLTMSTLQAIFRRLGLGKAHIKAGLLSAGADFVFAPLNTSSNQSIRHSPQGIFGFAGLFNGFNFLPRGVKPGVKPGCFSTGFNGQFLDSDTSLTRSFQLSED